MAAFQGLALFTTVSSKIATDFTNAFSLIMIVYASLYSEFKEEVNCCPPTNTRHL